ncbi:MAG: substrate-binding domain-containing protein, partial [Clostridia bacterium]|nr:substrate-binding domain-containing protein [Clostridia bacterium]
FNGNGAVDYVMIMGDPENVDAQYRTEFSVKALTDAGLTVNKLFEQRGDWDQTKGQELAANALTQFGNDVDVIFCNNDAMALGAYQAIVDAGRVVGEDIYLLGVDALAECVEMVNEGKMTGTVLNDHIGQSHTAADAAIKAAAGEKLEKYYWVDYVMVTK